MNIKLKVKNETNKKFKSEKEKKRKREKIFGVVCWFRDLLGKKMNV
jgi:hypothetical protein